MSLKTLFYFLLFLQYLNASPNVGLYPIPTWAMYPTWAIPYCENQTPTISYDFTLEFNQSTQQAYFPDDTYQVSAIYQKINEGGYEHLVSCSPMIIYGPPAALSRSIFECPGPVRLCSAANEKQTGDYILNSTLTRATKLMKSGREYTVSVTERQSRPFPFHIQKQYLTGGRFDIKVYDDRVEVYKNGLLVSYPGSFGPSDYFALALILLGIAFIVWQRRKGAGL